MSRKRSAGTSILATAGSIALLAAALLLGCGDAGDSSEQPPRESHDLSETACGDRLEASLRPSDDVHDATDVGRYDLTVEDSTLRVGLTDLDGENIGELVSTVDLEFAAATGLLEEWTVETRLREDGETPAAQNLRGRALGDGRLWFEIRHRAGETELIQWTVVDREGEAESMSLAVALDDGTNADGPDQIRGADGSVYETIEIVGDDGERRDAGEVRDWIEDRVGSDFFENSDWKRLVAVGNDPALWSGADAHVRRCAPDRTEQAANDLRMQQQSLCAYESAESADDDTRTVHSGLRARQQAQCETDPGAPFDFVLNADSALGSASAGALITAGLVAAGIVTTGPGIAIVFIGSSIAVWWVGNQIEAAVSNNGDTILDVGGKAGETFWDNDSGNDFEEFFGGSTGDPHIDTHDGLSYHFHGAGEYILVESIAGTPWTIQARQEPAAGICSGLAVNTAAATRIGGRRVAVYANRSDPLWIDGRPSGIPGGVLALPGGGVVERETKPSTRFEFRWPGLERLSVVLWERPSGANYLDLSVGLPNHRANQVRGLLGDFDGDPDNDIRAKGGATIGSPPGWLELTGVYGNSWRVDDSTSLFDYASGEDPTTFVDESFPERPTRIEDLPDDARTDAEKACASAGVENAAALESCILDVGCTGDPSFADSHTNRDPDVELEVPTPIFLDGWTNEGIPNQGNWEVSADGLSVEQTFAGKDQSFFVTPEDYQGTTIRGTVRVGPTGDDYIGLVFGYRAPLEAAGDPTDKFDTFLLSWKAQKQTVIDFTAQPGFALSHLNGTISGKDGTKTFFSRESTDHHEVIATDYGSQRGWREETTYPFALTYTSDEIVIVVAGEEIFRVAASEVDAPFEPGRFGVYTYSQHDVRYANIQFSNAEQYPAASLDGLEYGVERPGSEIDEFELETADPRICRDACRANAQCRSFTFRRAFYDGDPAYCWLKDSVPVPVDDGAYISGLR